MSTSLKFKRSMQRWHAKGAPVPSVALVIDSFKDGGAQRVAVRLLSAWVTTGYAVSAITFDDASTDFFSVPDGVQRHVIYGSSHSSNPLAAVVANVRRIRRLRRAIKASQADVVVSFITSTNLLVILASRGLGVRVVVSERNDPVRQSAGRVRAILRRLLYPLADVVTANSQHAVATMARYVPRRKLAMLPNPVGLPRLTAHPLKSRTIINVGRLVDQKRQDLIISAFAQLSRRLPEWRLVILGDGPNRQLLADHISAATLGGCVDMPGLVADTSRYYADAAIFVLASEYEGTPNALLEAMAHGLPCIVADCLPGALEHVENGVSGLVFRSGDADDLVRSLTALVDNAALRSRLGVEARGRMQAFTIEKVAKQWDDILFQTPSSGP